MKNTKELIKLQNQVVIITREAHKNEIELFKESFGLFSRIVNTVVSKKWNGNGEDELLDSYLILANKIISDFQSCYLLWERGLYGTAFAIIQVLIRSYNMWDFFMRNPIQ